MSGWGRVDPRRRSMAGSQGSSRIASITIVISALSLLAVIRTAMADTYAVGDSTGWSANADLKAWTAKKTFRVGDTLVFKYNSELHSVRQVSETAFKSCILNPSIASYQTGLDSIVLAEAKSYYFVCGTPGHCLGGMSMEISVSAGGSPSSSNSSAASPAPQISPSPPPAGSSPSPIPPSPSAISPSASPPIPSDIPPLTSPSPPLLPPIPTPPPTSHKNSASALCINTTTIITSLGLAFLTLLI